MTTSTNPVFGTTCPACGTAASVTYTREEESFPYGAGPDAATLSAIVDKGHCATCQLEFTDARAEEARDAAVRSYLRARTTNA
jgi:C4-type Zn-finger protein